jgi:hypothetical protein
MAVNERNTGGTNGDAERDPELERVYREAAVETPPARLDAAILAAARREVGARPRPISPMLRRWHVPVSIAAVIVVSVTLVVLMREEGVMHYRDLAAGDGARQEMARAPATAPQAKDGEVQVQSAPPKPATPAPLRPGSRDDNRSVTPSRKLGVEERLRRETEPSPAPAAGVMVSPEPAAKSLPQPLQAAPAKLADVAATPAPAGAVSGKRVESGPAESGEPLATGSVREAPRAKPVTGATLAKSGESDQVPVWHGLEKEPPEKWLARIEALRREGRAAEVEEMLSEFRRRFPSHPVPPAPSR